MKYAMVVPKEFLLHYESTPFEISGLLNWGKAMGGDIVTIDDDLSGYDVLHCNLSSTELHYPYKCRMENPDAVIVGNLDFAIDILQQYFVAIDELLDVIKSVDVVISVEPTQADWLQEMVGDAKAIHHCPHPTDVEGVLRYVNKMPPITHDAQERTVGVMWHQYEHNHILPLQMLNALQRRLKGVNGDVTINRKLMGIKPMFCTDTRIRFPVQHGIKLPQFMENMIAMSQPFLIPRYDSNGVFVEFVQGEDAYHFWDELVPYLPPLDFYQELMKCDLALDLYSIFSLGRFQMDCAICGIPSVVSDRSHSGKTLYPHTAVSLRRPTDIVARLVKIISDEDYANEVIKNAKGKLYEFDLPKSKEVMTKLVENFLQ